MKNIFKIMILSILVGGLFSACENDVIDPLTGKYPIPVDYTFATIASQNVVKQDGGVRAISLQLTSSEASFDIDFVVNAHYLKENTYTLVAGAGKNGNYTSARISKQGASAQNVTAGTIFVKLAGVSSYSINATLQLADNSFARVAYQGEIIFPEDPPAMTYALEIQNPYVYTPDGTNYIPIVGAQLNKFTIFADNERIAYLEIVTEENTKSYSGTYAVKSVTEKERAVVQGQYLDLVWFGVPPGVMPPIESGSFIVDDPMNQFIREGVIAISDNGGVLNFSSTNLKIQDIATQAAFGTLPNAVSIDYKDVISGGNSGGSATHTNLFSASALDLSMFGLSGFTVTLKMATPDLTVSVDGSGNSTYAGSGQYISFDFSTAAAALPVGTYNVVDNNMAKVGDCLWGYPSFFGAGFMGSFVGNVIDGNATEEVITGGVVDVTDNGLSFNLTTSSGTISGSYVGEIVLK